MTNHPTRMVVLRTPEFEELLQELWELRPDLRNKPTATAHSSTAALIRETKHTLAEVYRERHAVDSELSIQGYEKGLVSPQEESQTAAQETIYKDPHPDSVWQ